MGRPRKQIIVQITSIPSCFESVAQWVEWKSLANFSGKFVGREIPYCEDCLPDYRDRMILAGKCTHPETVFISEPGGVGVTGMTAEDRGYSSLVKGRKRWDGEGNPSSRLLPQDAELLRHESWVGFSGFSD
jgi:hypothetical protein